MRKRINVTGETTSQHSTSRRCKLRRESLPTTSSVTAGSALVTTLARMARFVIADLTDARSVLQKLENIVPDLPSLAVRLMIKKSAHEYGMLGKIRKYPWVIEDTYEYENANEVIASIKAKIIGPAEAKVQELRAK